MRDDFGDSADGAGDNSAAAGHGFEVDDAEGLIDRGANKNSSVAVELDLGFVVEHLIDPDNAVAQALGLGHGRFHFGCDLRCVGGSGAEDDLEAGVEVLDRVDEVDDAFLAGNTAEEEGVGIGRVDAETVENAARGDGLVFGGVDAVVNDMEAGRIDLEKFLHIAACALGNGDNGVGHFEGGAFEPAGEIVSTTELLAFPGTERLERVDSDDEGYTIIQLGKDAAEVGIPRVAMHHARIDIGGVEIQAALECAEYGLKFFGGCPIRCVEAKAVSRKLTC